MPVDPSLLVNLQSRPECIRNICILAHVDHGKTSLSDCLLASNGVISQSMQGKIRYLDSRPDEQLRGITMESSAISLYFKVMKSNKEISESKPTVHEYLINLIDSPGHIDFSSEVSTASRLCDGGIVVVDVVEGVCSQTVTVLRQTWTEKIKPILLLNKIDRLITELQLSPSEAYNHLSRIIEQVNAVMGSFFMGQRMEDDMRWRELVEHDGHVQTAFTEASDEDLYFAPEKNNVVFGSALDGWGFNISQFAAMYEKKIGVDREKLERVLWGDFFFDPKTKKVIPGSHLRKSGASTERLSRPLFVQLVLENIWSIYQATGNREHEKISKIIKALELKVHENDIKTKDDRSLLLNILNQWIPMSRSILLSVIDLIPSPKQTQKDRIPFILETTPGKDNISKHVVQSMLDCDTKGPMVSFVSKVVAVRKSEIPTEKPNSSRKTTLDELRMRSQRIREMTDNTDIESSVDKLELDDDNDDPELAIGFARVYSGTIKAGKEYYLLGPKYDPSHDKPDENGTPVTITGLYILMGRELILIDEAAAGSIIGIGGLDGKILKSGTLVSKEGGPNLASTNTVAQPILRVAVEPVDPTKIPQLEEGLRLLNISDPCVQVTVNDNGEHILATAGELHLERCIKDLKERFAKIDIHYSKPVVPYRETFVEERSLELKTEDIPGVSEVELGGYTLRFHVSKLSDDIVKIISRNSSVISKIIGDESDKYSEDREQLKQELNKQIEQEKSANIVNEIVAFGPRRNGPNVLVDGCNALNRRVFSEGCNRDRSKLEESIISGFQMAMLKGPLVGEPIEGAIVVLKGLEKTEETSTDEETTISKISGRVITASRQAIHNAISSWSPRLMLAMYQCDIQATADVLGKVYGVVSKRRGKILTEEMKEGTPFFSIHASIPVQEAFGFSEEIRKRTSGAAYPQLVFSGFQVLDMDPYWVPSTIEELEDLGEKADRENVALKYVVALRRRKGMAVAEKLVESGERQRNMKR